MRSAARELQDKDLVGSLDRFVKRAGSRDSVDSILTHVSPYCEDGHSVERGLYSHTTSSVRSGLNTHMVTEDNIITVRINNNKLK